MWKKLVLVSLIAAACQPTIHTTVVQPTAEPLSQPQEETPSPSEPAIVHSDTPLIFTMGDIEVSLYPPVGWETHQDEQGIVLAEHGSTIEESGEIAGLLAYVFVQHLADTLPNATEDSNKAWSILKHITDKTRERTILVSQPVAFQWSDHDAAYYLVTDINGIVAIIIAVISPNSDYVVAMYISTSSKDAATIRRCVPRLFEGLSINGVVMDSAALEALPDPLVFPMLDTKSITNTIHQ